MTEKYPAPWTLHGRGYIFAYKFSKKFRGGSFFKTDFLEDNNFSGFGTMMLVNYDSSTAGPYYELLFIPGKFAFKGHKYYSITKIFVSTMESVENGRENWGIPKELADFTFTTVDDKRERITVSKDNIIIMDITIKRLSFPYPVNTKYFPLPLIQKYKEKLYFTTFQGNGKGRLSKIESIYINDQHFPAINRNKPLWVKKIEDFTITFPVADIVRESS